MSATPTKVFDGQPVAITVKSAPGYKLYAAIAKVCRAGVNYQVGTADGAARDFDSGGPNCPQDAISSSSSLLAQDIPIVTAGTAAGDTFLYRVGAGSTKWTFPLGTATTNNVSLTCGPTDPCDLVVEVSVQPDGQPARWEPFVQPLTYASDDPTSGCGGPAGSVLSSGGSDRMFDTWVNWTLGECQLPGRKGAASRASFTGEGDSVKTFASGGLDLAYTNGGYDDAMGLVATDPSQPNGGLRPAVNVPLGLNATVLAVGGGIPVNGHIVPYRDVKLKAEEVAGLLRGATTGERQYDDAIRARNPGLVPVFDPVILGTSIGTGTNGDSGDARAAALPGADANSWYMSRMLKSVVPDAWKVPDQPVSRFPSIAGMPRGIDSALALATPSFSSSLLLLSGRPPVQKIVATQGGGGGFWYLTDLQSALALGLSPVQIETTPGSGNFVAPSPATMAAAVPTMVRDSHGILIGPDPKAAATANNPRVYPLTYVEYALAPAQPLVNSDCTKRDVSQALLKGWLNYITGDGQNKLAPGMAPLTPALQADAAKAVPLVGALPVTGTCAAAAAQTTTTKAPGSHPAATSVPRRSSSNPSGGSTSHTTVQPYAAPGQAAAPAPAPTSAPTPKPASSALSPTILLPAFAGSAAVRYGGVVVGLLGIMALSGLAAAGRTPTGLAWRRRLKTWWRPDGVPSGPDTG